MSELTLVPLSLRQAKEYVTEHHRHHKAPVGHKFSVGVERGGELVGVAVAGRPVARAYDDGMTLEVTRTATDGTRNVNSKMYGAIRRAAKALGYRRLITYTQDGETGASLRGAGWVESGTRKPRAGWDTPARRRTNDSGPTNIERTLWEAIL